MNHDLCDVFLAFLIATLIQIIFRLYLETIETLVLYLIVLIILSHCRHHG